MLSTTATCPNDLVSPRNSSDATPVSRPQLPVNRGLRFSMNALRPST
jgi:hypothetical protein